jgi:hypothetical protein
MHRHQGERLCPLLKKKPAVKQPFSVVNAVVAYCINYCKFDKSQVVPFIFQAAATALTIDNNCVIAGGFKNGA